MLIRKNTKAFKTIVEIISACQQMADREKFIRLYITKAGHTVHDRISVEGIQGDAALFYEMNYQIVERMRRDFPKITVLDDARFVDSGNILTTAGVSAGIDGALHLVSRIKGIDVAKATARYKSDRLVTLLWRDKSHLGKSNPSNREQFFT